MSSSCNSIVLFLAIVVLVSNLEAEDDDEIEDDSQGISRAAALG